MENITDIVRELLFEKVENIEEKRMFGGICFMVNEKMCVATKPHRIMLRIDPMQYEKIAETENINPMVHGGKATQSFIYVDVEGLSLNIG
jgi:TfoX/Sxy family transcriptional regulator of competence genes